MTQNALPPDLSAALALHQSGRLAEADAAYQAILERAPDHVDALYLLSSLRLQQGKTAAALALAERVIELDDGIADAHGNRGSALQALGRHDEAAEALRMATLLAPQSPHIAFNFGNALRTVGDKSGAVAAYRRAVELAPDLVPAHSNLGATLSELGLFDEAAMHCRTALGLAPSFADAHYNLGNALREAGHLADAVTAYRAALDHDADHADACCNLGLTLMASNDLDTAVNAFADALRADPEHKMAAFYRAIAVEMSGARADEAFRTLDEDDRIVHSWLDSWAYVKSHSDMRTAIVHEPRALLSAALSDAMLDGLVLEFGVRHGASIRHIATKAGQAVHGFDSFEGLPSAWDHEPQGVYSTGGQLPDVPANVTLHAGLFADTLPAFLAAHKGPVRFCNIDCDLYASAVDVLTHLAPRIQPGSVLVFDEYLINPTWREDEFKAFQEAVSANGWRYRYLAFGIVTKQAAVIVEES